MQTKDRLLKRRILPTLLGLTLLGGLTAVPAFAQSDKDHKMHHNTAWDDDDMMFDPAPMSYPQAAPGSIHLYHWKDYTQTKMEPGSAADKRWEIEHKKDKKRHEREHAAYFHKTLDEDITSDISTTMPTTETTTTTVEIDTLPDVDTISATTPDTGNKGIGNDRYTGIPTDSPWSLSFPDDVVLWPDPPDMAAGQGYVYILRGNTLYQMRTDDMSLQALNSLPWLNSQTNYDLPQTAQGVPTQQEDMDVYNKTAPDELATGNIDTEQNVTAEQTIPDISVTPPDTIEQDETSDLNVKTYFHRSNGDDADLTEKPVMTTNGEFLYVLRGNMLYQLRTSDLSLVSQTDLDDAP